MGCIYDKPQNKNIQSQMALPSKQLITKTIEIIESQTTEITLSTENIYKLYRFDRLIGSGKFGIVKLAYLRRDISKVVAIKSIAKVTLKENLNMLKRELGILRTLDHPNVTRFYETYEDVRYVHFVMEYCSGGDMLDNILVKKYFTEKEAQSVMATLFNVISYLHFKGIIHRDIKPQNMIFACKGDYSTIKLIDFGLSKKYREELLSMWLQKYWMASISHYEWLRYSYECDNWSLGVIMYVLLCGSPPFYSENSSEVFSLIKRGVVTFEQRQWATISSEAKDLIKKLLTVDVSIRIKSCEAQKHPWFGLHDEFPDDSARSPDKQSVVIQKLKRYSQSKRLKKEALKIFLGQMEDKEIQKLYKNFMLFDIEKNGIITVREMMQVMQSLGHSETETEVEKFISQFQTTGNKEIEDIHINYSEFIAATLDKKLYLDQEKLWNIFQYFDTDQSGEITLDNMIDVMARSGRNMPKKEIKSILSEGHRKLNKINFDEFSEIMKDDYQDKDILLNLETSGQIMFKQKKS